MHTCTFIFANFLFYLICSARSEILEFFFQSLLMDSDESFYLDFFFFFYTLWNLKFTYNSKCWMADEMKMLQLILVHEHEIPTKKKWFRSNDLFFFQCKCTIGVNLLDLSPCSPWCLSGSCGSITCMAIFHISVRLTKKYK